MKNFLSVRDVDDIDALVSSAMAMKKDPWAHRSVGADKTMVLLFLNPSLRTRLSTQKAALNLGMQCIVMNVGQDGWQLEFENGVVMDSNKAEHVKEAAAVISQYANIIGLRTFAGLVDRESDYSEKVLNAFLENVSVPVVNLESATLHPLQSLTDLLTIREAVKMERPKIVLSWAPHPKALPQAVSNSFVEWMLAANMDVTITNPVGYDLSPEFRKDADVLHDQEEALTGADIVYTKNWSSFDDYGKQPKVEQNWTINESKMNLTNHAKFMHCLPVRRNVVVDDAVLDSANSLVIQQAANREWAAQAVLKSILEGM